MGNPTAQPQHPRISQLKTKKTPCRVTESFSWFQSSLVEIKGTLFCLLFGFNKGTQKKKGKRVLITRKPSFLWIEVNRKTRVRWVGDYGFRSQRGSTPKP